MTKKQYNVMIALIDKTFVELAKELDLSKITLSHYSTGLRPVSAKTQRIFQRVYKAEFELATSLNV